MREQKPKDGQVCDLKMINDAGNIEAYYGFTFSVERDGWFKPFFEEDAFGRVRLAGQTFFGRTAISGKINPQLAKWTPSPTTHPRPNNPTRGDDE